MAQEISLASHPGTLPIKEDAVATSLPHSAQLNRSAFLDLPPEMRNIIYDWLFPTDSPVQLLARYRGGYIDMGDRLGLLTTCRQVYVEASSLLRCDRRFVVLQPKTLLDVISHIDDYDRYHTLRSPPLSYSDSFPLVPYSFKRELVRLSSPFRDVSLRYDLVEGTFENRVPPIYSTCTRAKRMFRQACGTPTIYVTTAITDEFRGLERWTQNFRMKLGPKSPMPDSIVVRLRLPRKDTNGSTHHYFPAVRFIRAAKDLRIANRIRVVAANEDGAYTIGEVILFSLFAHILGLVHRMCKIFPDHAKRLLPPIWIDQNLKFILAEFNGQLYQTSLDIHDPGPHIADANKLLEHYFHKTRPNMRNNQILVSESTICTKEIFHAKDTLIGFEEELAGQIWAST